MRAPGVALGEEAVEFGFLLERAGACRPRGFLLEGEMHPCMTAILLRVSRPDALDADAGAEPPERKLGKVEQPVGG